MINIKKKWLKTIPMVLCVTLIVGFVPNFAFAETVVNSDLAKKLEDPVQTIQAIGTEKASLDAFYTEANQQLEKQNAATKKK